MHRYAISAGVAAAVIGFSAAAGVGQPAAQPPAKAAGQPAAKGEAKLSKDDVARAKRAQQFNGAVAMAEYGREQKAPEALIAAARVIGTTPAVTAKEAPGKEPAKELPKEEPSTVFRDQAEALLKEAAALAADSKDKDHLEALIRATRTEIETSSRAPVGGMRTFPAVFLAPGDSRDYQVDLIGGFTTASVQRLTGFGQVQVQVRGALTGLDYGGDTRFGNASRGFQHLPIAKVVVTMRNLGGAGSIQASVY